MRSLSLIRHAKSDWGAGASSDHARPLNARGVRDAPEMARRLLERGGRFDLVLASDARRVQETLALMREIWGDAAGRVESISGLYLASAGTIRKAIESQAPELRHLAVVGHNPGMSELAKELGAAVVDMPTAAVITFEYPELDSWMLLEAATAARIIVDFPKQPYAG